jgi:hypothetical protein
MTKSSSCSVIKKCLCLYLLQQDLLIVIFRPFCDELLMYPGVRPFGMETWH